MAFDGMFTHAMVHSLQFLMEASVSKIAQPFADEIVLTLRKNRKNYRLLLVANPQTARIGLIDANLGNQALSANFLMLLRKHLEKARLTAIKQVDCDRIVNLYFATRDELGDQTQLILSLEMMGRHSNLILYEQNTNKIIDTIRHVSIAQNRYRILLPQATYRRPPQQEKIALTFDTQPQLASLTQQFANIDELATNISKTFQGFGKTNATMLAQACLSLGSASAFSWFNKALTTPQPCVVLVTRNQKIKRDFSFIAPLAATASNPLVAFEKTKIATDETTAISLSQLVVDFYVEQARLERVQSSGKKLVHAVKQALKRNEIKLHRQRADLTKSENAAEYRHKGELLTTFMYQIKHGSTTVTVTDYYNNDQPLKISLNPQLSPAQNAQRYFKRYTKLKNSVSILNEQIEKTSSEIAYLSAVLIQINQSSPQDLTDIELELIKGGYITQTLQKSGKKRKLPHRKTQPAVYFATDGTKLSVGKSNLQNEHLTLKTAHKHEWWLHTKNIPGAHVIVHSKQPSKQTLLEAAQLAAYFSKFSQSQNVPVDYTQVKWIKKPKKTKPGFVIYTHQKTVFVTPTKEKIAQLTLKPQQKQHQ